MWKIIVNNKNSQFIKDVGTLLSIRGEQYEIEVDPLVEFKAINVKSGEVFTNVVKIIENIDRDLNDKILLRD